MAPTPEQRNRVGRVFAAAARVAHDDAGAFDDPVVWHLADELSGLLRALCELRARDPAGRRVPGHMRQIEAFAHHLPAIDGERGR